MPIRSRPGLPHADVRHLPGFPARDPSYCDANRRPRSWQAPWIPMSFGSQVGPSPSSTPAASTARLGSAQTGHVSRALGRRRRRGRTTRRRWSSNALVRGRPRRRRGPGLRPRTKADHADAHAHETTRHEGGCWHGDTPPHTHCRPGCDRMHMEGHVSHASDAGGPRNRWRAADHVDDEDQDYVHGERPTTLTSTRTRHATRGWVLKWKRISATTA